MTHCIVDDVKNHKCTGAVWTLVVNVTVESMLCYNNTRRYLKDNGRVAVIRGLSSSANLPKSSLNAEDRLSSQPFVKTRLDPGEWDHKHTNPLYRPKFRSSAKIISADDFANRPAVGLSEEFESFQDAMITISWLDQNDHKLVFQLYLDLMVSAEASSGGRTSHEYVMRVIAQKFNITADRVAAIVQLQHNEQQMILENPDIELCTDIADELDQEFKAEIAEAYQALNLKKPEAFVEDPAGTADLKPTKKWVIVDDVFDVDQMSEDAIIREERDARLIIDGHVYIEDKDRESIPVPLDKDCRSLLTQRNTIDKKMKEENARVFSERAKNKAIEPAWRTTNGEGETRERYKFIAQTVNTRQLKKARAKHRSYINNNVANTLVEHNGELRAGNMADMTSLSWKAIRNDHEHTYAGAKQGWLDRMNRNATKSWGRAPVRIPRLQHPVPIPPAETETVFVGSLDKILTADGTTDGAEENIVLKNDAVGSELHDKNSHTKDVIVPITAAASAIPSKHPESASSSTADLSEAPHHLASSEHISAVDIIAASDVGSVKEDIISSTSEKEAIKIAAQAAEVGTPISAEIAATVSDVELSSETNTTVTAAISTSLESVNVVDIAAHLPSSTMPFQEHGEGATEIEVLEYSDVVAPNLIDIQKSTLNEEEQVKEMNATEVSLMSSPSFDDKKSEMLPTDISTEDEKLQSNLATSEADGKTSILNDAVALPGDTDAYIKSAVSIDKNPDETKSLTDHIDKT